MAKDNRQSSKKWLGVIILILFGALIAWDFSAIQNKPAAIVIGIIIALAVTLVSKALDVELGWPKN
jgi:hypothetical protein